MQPQGTLRPAENRQNCVPAQLATEVGGGVRLSGGHGIVALGILPTTRSIAPEAGDAVRGLAALSGSPYAIASASGQGQPNGGPL